MVSSSTSAPSLSYADRAKHSKLPSSSHSPTPSSTSTTDVEKSGEDAFNGGPVNGLSPPSNPTPNFWAVRKEQMAARTVPPAASSSSSPTLAASPSLPASAPLRSSRDINGVDLTDASSWPQVAAVSTPTKDRSGGAPSKDPTTPTPTPKKSEKKKWVPIPPTELQAAADAATRGRSSPKHTSAATSAHSSPKVASRGRRLPNEEPSHDARRRSPSRLATHAYTHPFNSPSRPSSSFVLPAAAPHAEPHHPPLTLQKRPASPAHSGAVAGYRDIDDLKLGEGRLVMFGSIGAPATSADASPLQRGLGLDVSGGVDGDGRKRQEVWDVGRRVGGGFAIGLAPEELERTRIVKAARRRSAPPDLALTPEIVDLTDGAWLGSRGGEERGTRERKWEFGTSRHHPDAVSSSSSPLPSHQPLQQFPPPQMPMYAPPPPPPHMSMYAPPPGPPMSVSAPESVVGDPTEYDARPLAYGEPYAPGMERERRGGYAGPGRRGGRYAGGRGGPNGSVGRGYGGRRGGGPSQHQQHYGAQHYAPAPAAYQPPPPPPGPDGYYMGPPYSLPYAPYAPPPIPPYAVPPVMDARTAPAPVPMPVTVTSFPIDPTRWYLLGQLEYYFSVQNLCTDFWLRKQMDNRGWVPISVIASFNRVRHLTFDTALVRDVLSLSALVEVQGEKVRLRERRWEPFVLPDAPVSDVTEPVEPQFHHPPEDAGEVGEVGLQLGADEGEVEEEEVEFVMGKESEDRRAAAAPWAPGEGAEQRPPQS